MDSILTSVKKMLGITEEYEHFDADIIIHINTVFMTLCQIGVGPSNGFSISDKSTTWKDYLGEDSNLEAVKTYMYLKVKTLFDTGSMQSGAVAEAVRSSIAELEWRISVSVDPGKQEGNNG